MQSVHQGICKNGFLETEGRVAFSELEDEKVIAMVDWKRAKNEIPYIDLKKTKRIME